MARVCGKSRCRRIAVRGGWLTALGAALVLMCAIALPGQQPPGASPAPQPKASAKAPKAEAKPEPKPPTPAPPKKKFYEQEPFDVITLDKANDNVSLKVMPLPFADQRMPDESQRVGKLKVRLFDKREEEYEVLWRAIERIEFFADFVLRETERIVADATRLAGQGKYGEAERQFDEAWDYYHYLLRHYPNTLRLQESLQTYLYLNALSLFKQDRITESFAVLEELYRRNAAFRHEGGTVQSALEHVGDRLIGQYVQKEDHVAARMLMARLKKDYGNRLNVASQWREKLNGMAARLRDEAAAHLAAKRFREAHEASRQMLKIWPTVEGGRELVLDIARAYPLIVVGVSAPALTFDASSLDDPAARRAGRLLHRTLLSYTERGTDGGRYECPYGTVQTSDDRMRLIFDLRQQDGAAPLTGYDLSRHLLALADPAGPNYQPSWAALMAGLAVQDVDRVQVELRRPHVLPQALLQTRLTGGDRFSARYAVASRTDTETRFEPLAAGPEADQLKPVIVERFYPEPRDAIRALRKGKIDMIDRVLPTDAMRLTEDASLEIRAYGLPKIHVLVPNPENPFLANRTFRRALVYGINREVILNKGLLNGEPMEGCRVLSAPFPAGVSRTDPSAYAYDERIAPRPYDPVMAAILVRLAEQQLAAAADRREEPAPELGELVIAHPPFELPRFVCKQIQVQLKVAGVQCALHELAPGQVWEPEGLYDLQYLELTMPEPLVDLARVFGDGGIAPSTDPYVGLALRQLEQAENWKDVRLRLHELHRLIHEEVTVVPLWQMIDHFVAHRGVRGLRDRPVFFYQNVESWRVVPPAAED